MVDLSIVTLVYQRVLHIRYCISGWWYLPLWNYEFVSWDDKNPNSFWKVIKFHGSSHHQSGIVAMDTPRFHGSNQGFLSPVSPLGQGWWISYFDVNKEAPEFWSTAIWSFFFISVWCHISLQFPLTLYIYIYRQYLCMNLWINIVKSQLLDA